MKKIVIALVILVAYALCQTEPRPRFENIYNENHYGSFPSAFYVWHDKESGQEVVCAAGIYSGGLLAKQYHPSCWPTGRSWK